MSQINYSVYGNPEEWTHWQNATPQSGLQGTLWGQQRIGASDWANADFTNYPYFMFGKETIYRNYKNSGYIDINTPFDNSISYTAMANPDLPQQNVMIFDINHSSISDPVAQTNAAEPSPFAFSWYYYGTSHISNPGYQGSLYGFDGFPNNASVFGAQGMQRQAPYALWDSTFTNTWGKYNPNLRIAPCVRFGVKSIILEIKVIYKTTGDYPIAQTTFKDYLNHTTAWLQEHKLIAAFCQPYYRSNVDGSYTETNAATSTDRFGGISTLFFRPYNLQGIKIYNYTAYLSSDLNISGNLPIYGSPVTDGFWNSLNVDGYYNYEDPTDTNMNSYACLFGTNRGELVKTVTESQLSCHMELDMSIADNVEYIMRGAAAYGLFFCKEIGTLGNAGRDADRWVDDDMYLGVIRSDGMTYGDYTHGLDNATQQQYDWKSSTETPFVPSQDINVYSNQTRIRAIGHIDTMCDRYVLNSIAVNALAVDLFTIMSDLSDSQTDWTELIEKSIDTFLVQNPIDCIVSLKKYPVKTIPNTGDLTNIHYGRYSTGSAAGYPCTADVYTYAFTPRKIQPRFGNSYLDYEPFTSAEIFIPYCGSINLKMCDILDKQLEPFLCVDYHTGQCTGFVMCDGIVIETIQGTIAIDVPITGIQTATVESQLMQSANASRSVRLNQAFSAIEGLGKITLGAKFGGALGGATGLANAAKTISMQQMQKYQADYDLTHTAAPQHVIGSSSSACGWIIDSDTARLILYYPTGGVINDDNPPNLITAKLEDFGALYGFATIESGTLSSYTGFTAATQMQLDNITTAYGQPATDPEIELIRSAISEGIII